jgi:hypothetical protein
VNGQLANFKQQKPIEVWALATYDKPKAHLVGRHHFQKLKHVG